MASKLMIAAETTAGRFRHLIERIEAVVCQGRTAGTTMPAHGFVSLSIVLDR